MPKKIVIIGAGPAGLTAALEILRSNKGIDVIVIEADENIGGLSRTIDWNGNKFDIGGHRFFTTNKYVERWWNDIMSMESVSRRSSIFYNGLYIDYPIRFSMDTIRKIGMLSVFGIASSYICTKITHRKIDSLEDFFISRFGEKLYYLFFYEYSKKLWGKEPSLISPEWGPQRIEGISLWEVIKSIFLSRSNEPSLTDHFLFPRMGCGEFWNTVADQVQSMGGRILTNCEVKEIRQNNNHIDEVICRTPSGKIRISGDYYISSMPIQNLCDCMKTIPEDILSVADRLRYRDMIIVAVLVNNTNIYTYREQWIYVQNKDVGFGRIQIINNWSHDMVKHSTNEVLLVLEYFCQENDPLWNTQDVLWRDMLTTDLKKIGFIRDEKAIVDYCTKRIKKAYPCYWDGYADIDVIWGYIDSLDNITCVGRNGQHKYSNMDDVIFSTKKRISHLLC